MSNLLKFNLQFFAEEPIPNVEPNTNGTEQINVEEIRTSAINDLLKDLGVENSDNLRNIITEHNNNVAQNQTELQRVNGELTTTKNLLEQEKELRLTAEAKATALKLGAKPELVENLIVIAKTRVTENKDIEKVMSEMKQSEAEKIYFVDENVEQNKNKNITRPNIEKKKDKEDEPKTNAERLLGKRVVKKSHYFGN